MKNFVSYNKFIRNVIFLSVIYIIVLFLFYGKFIQSTSIEKSIKDMFGTDMKQRVKTCAFQHMGSFILSYELII